MAEERDACGIGFVADARGRPSRAIVDAGLEGLARVAHRGAVAADALSADGAGLLLPLPRHLIDDDEPRADRLGAAMVFSEGKVRPLVEEACASEGLEVLRWRSVPVDPAVLGSQAAATMPVIEQAVVLRGVGTDTLEGEHRAFRARKRIEQAARQRGARCYVASFSFLTITYKALCRADTLADFYPDLTDERFEAWFALFHQRFATNTTPTWERAQPLRFLGHNGEINTIRGNVALLRAREGRLGSHDLCAEDLLVPVVDEEGSDSMVLDEALELLVRGGRDLEHAAAMLVPQAWEDVIDLDEDVRAFLRYHSCLLEPWDGPAALVFSDGTKVGAALDRNGLRPLRVAICEDGLVAAASEAGAVATRGHGRVRRLKLGPGQALSVDPTAGGVADDAVIKKRLAARRPYAEWVGDHMVEASTGQPLGEAGPDVVARQVAAGYNREDFTVILRPMATEGHEPTSSMGDDTPIPPLVRFPRSVFSFFKQRFAQVTNPPIDHLRERDVMSISTKLGPRAPLLQERPEAASLREYRSFLLFPDAVTALQEVGGVTIDATCAPQEGLKEACRRVASLACDAVTAGAPYVVVSDEGAGPEQMALPSALAAGAIHHRLIATGLRTAASIVVVADDVRESHHAACLLTNGVDAICPRLALESIVDLAHGGRLGGNVDAEQAQGLFFQALEDGVLKIMSKMGISTLDSYRGAQIIEALGLGEEVISLCFNGINSPLGGLDFGSLAEDLRAKHREGWGKQPKLTNIGWIKNRTGGEFHAVGPEVVESLQVAVGRVTASGDPGEAQEGRGETEDDAVAAAHHLRRAVRGDPEAYARFTRLVTERHRAEPRDLLELRATGEPVPRDEVEPIEAITRRFSTGAMSHGALSEQAHATLAVALRMVGGKANTGEGGEDPARYESERNSGIKQIASGRFGVTPAYVGFAEELQIKMAQGSKPGEGGQLPGRKVTVEIARLRHTVPGVALISPPPHHDIYSIEDLAQLVYDLKQANPRAPVSVKLVASEGVGTIAAGVVKALAEVVHIAGGDGGTGASPLSSIKNAGLPWEIGLADAHRALIEEGLRGRARLRVDGGLKNGRDIVMAALLGADEFSFGTMALVAEGCILVRTCHRNTCPVGIATQDPKLRAKYAGTPEMVVRYLTFVAEEVRTMLASLGLRSLAEAVGRVDLLEQRQTGEVRADSLDLTPLLDTEVTGQRSYTGSLAIQRPRSELGDRLYQDAVAALDNGRGGRFDYRISTRDRAVGARLGTDMARRYGHSRAPGTVRARFEGEAGQSFGCFLSSGIELELKGEANDYVGRAMGGGRIAIKPPDNDAGHPFLAGNTVLYGATGGSLFLAGRVGERFAVRNSGAVAVVEGTGDHCCEYMTAGAVIVLGPTGRNFGAGMSGGEAYVYDPNDVLETKLNHQLVAAYEPTPGQLASLRRVIERHVEMTSSAVASDLLTQWKAAARSFKRVAPVAEVQRLEALFEGSAVAATT